MNVASNPAGDQGFASADVLADGSTLIRWSVWAGIAPTPFAERFDTDGDRLGGAFAVPGQFAPLTGGGGVAVTSRQRGTTGDDLELRAQRYDASGAAVGEPVTVNTDRIRMSHTQIEITALPGGGFVVTWENQQFGPVHFGRKVLAQFLDADGQKVGAEIVASDGGSDNSHSLAVLADGSVAVCWQTSPIGYQGDIRFSIIGSDGAVLEFNKSASTITPTGQHQPTISALANGGFVIGWVELGERSDTYPSSAYAARAQVFDANGAKVGGEVTVSNDTTPGKGDIGILGLGEGGFFAAWQESDAFEVRAQLYDDLGRKISAVGAISLPPGDPKGGHAIADIIETAPGTIGFVLNTEGGRGPGGTGTDVEIVYWSATLDPLITGTTGDDTLRGMEGEDVIIALAGSDIIYGSEGRDSVDGGAGHDRLQFVLGDMSNFAAASGPRSFTVANGVISGAGGAIETIFENMEVVRLDLRDAGDFGDVIDGSGQTSTAPTRVFEFLLGAGNDVVTGTAATDLIVGGLGRLTANGGAGDDLAVTQADFARGEVLIRRAGDRVVVTQGGTEIADLRLIERLQVVAAGTDTAGTRVDAAGVDVSLVLVDTGGVDTLIGGIGSDRFISFTNADTGGQADRYTGGGGADMFDFSRVNRAMDGTVITDFGADDRIALVWNVWPADALNLPIGSFIGRAAFSGTPGEVRYTPEADATYLQIDGDGDGVADATLTLAGGPLALGMSADRSDPFSGPYVTVRPGVTVLNGTANADTIAGTAGDDEIAGLGDDLIEGGAGDDDIDGGGDSDYLYGGDGSDRIDGGAGGDQIGGGDGDDNVIGASGSDWIGTGAGDDRINGGADDDDIDGGEGTDTAVFGSMFRQSTVEVLGFLTNIRGSDGRDTVTEVERFQFPDGVYVIDPDSAGAQVQRLYKAVLGRAADKGGLDFYVDMLEDRGGTLLGIASELVGSAEFKVRATAWAQTYGEYNNGQFVRHIYTQALGRSPDVGGQAYYMQAFDRGMSRGAFAVELSESAEHRALTANLVGQGYFNTDDSYQAVALLYDSFMGRHPDGAGLAFYGDRVKSGQMTLAQVAGDFAGSAEFRAAVAGKSDAELVDTIYRNSLDRAPDPGGAAYYTDRLDGGMAVSDFVAEIGLSVEHYNLYAAHIIGGIDVI